MNRKSTIIFIQHYEKLTKWMLKTTKQNANMVININESQKIPSKLNKIYLKSIEDNYLFHIQDYQSDLLVRINKVIE